MINHITCPDASPPHGHYSHATVHNGTIYVCGLLGNSLEVHKDTPRSVTLQTNQCLKDLSLILDAAGGALSTVLQATVYVTDIDDWGEINAEWMKWFGDCLPARAVVPGSRLRYGSALEVVVIASTKD